MTDSPLFIAPIDTVPTQGSDSESYFAILRSLADPIRNAMGDTKTVDFISRIRNEYQLDNDQQTRFAEFVRDVLMGLPVDTDLAGELSERISVEKKTAMQMLRVLERDILILVGLSLKDIGRDSAGPIIREEDGRLLLRYRTIDDLLAAVDDLPPAGRMQFLKDASADNRILVIKALTHLKLGADSKGRPLSFKELVMRDAPDFAGRDWVDVLQEDHNLLEETDVHQALVLYLSDPGRIASLFSDVVDAQDAVLFHKALSEALARSKPAVVDFVKWSPYFAGVFNVKTGLNKELFERFAELADVTRSQIVSQDMSDRIATLIKEGTIPENYGVAVAKIVFFIAVGHIQSESLGSLLGEKLGLGTERGQEIAERISGDLLGQITYVESEPPSPESFEEKVEASREETKEVERSAKTPRSDKIASMKNVVDLRKHSEG